LFPVVGEATLRDLVREAKATETAFRSRVRTVLRSSYSTYYRRMLPRLLAALEFRSNNQAHQPLVEAVELLRAYSTRSGAVRRRRCCGRSRCRGGPGRAPARGRAAARGTAAAPRVRGYLRAYAHRLSEACEVTDLLAAVPDGGYGRLRPVSLWLKPESGASDPRCAEELAATLET
jgi:hypothetical protein